MTTHTFALMTPSATHYLDVERAEGDQRAWRDILLERGLADGLVLTEQLNDATVLPAVRPPSPSAHWR